MSLSLSLSLQMPSLRRHVCNPACVVSIGSSRWRNLSSPAGEYRRGGEGGQYVTMLSDFSFLCFLFSHFLPWLNAYSFCWGLILNSSVIIAIYRFPNILQRWFSSEQPRFDFCIQIAPPDLRLLINPSKKL